MNTDDTIPPYLTAQPSPESVAFWNACERMREPITAAVELENLRQRCHDLADRWQSSPPMNHLPDYTAQAFARELRAIINPTQP